MQPSNASYSVISPPKNYKNRQKANIYRTSSIDLGRAIKAWFYIGYV